MRRVYTCQHLLSFTAKVGMIHFAVPMLNPSKDWSIGLDWTSVVAQCWIYCIRNKILNGCYTYYKLWYSILHLIFTAVNFHKKSIDCTCMNKDYFKVLKILNLSWPSLFSWYQNLKNKLKNYIPSPSGNFNLQRIVIFAHFQAEETLHIDSLTNTDVLNFFQRFYGKSLPFGNQSFSHPYIGLLSIEQALGDYAVLLTTLRQELNATSCPVIAFGGRFGNIFTQLICLNYKSWMAFAYMPKKLKAVQKCVQFRYM